MILKFDDGTEVRTDGPLRTTHLPDGYYVVGDGLCIPVATRGEGRDLVQELRKQQRTRTSYGPRDAAAPGGR
jgi:hypothetical protein